MVFFVLGKRLVVFDVLGAKSEVLEEIWGYKNFITWNGGASDFYRFFRPHS